MDLRKIVTGLAAASTLVVGLAAGTTQASADQWRHGWRDGGIRYGGWNRGYDRRGSFGGYRQHRRGWSGGSYLGAGAIGLGVGAIVGGAIAGSSYDRGYYGGNRYYSGNRYFSGGYYEEPQVVYVPVPVERSPRARAYVYDAVSACAARYRSYDARTNTFLGYDGFRHPCRL